MTTTAAYAVSDSKRRKTKSLPTWDKERGRVAVNQSVRVRETPEEAAERAFSKTTIEIGIRDRAKLEAEKYEAKKGLAVEKSESERRRLQKVASAKLGRKKTVPLTRMKTLRDELLAAGKHPRNIASIVQSQLQAEGIELSEQQIRADLRELKKKSES